MPCQPECCDLCALAKLDIAESSQTASAATTSSLHPGPAKELGWQHFQSPCTATGLLAWSYTSRTALIRVSGSSNWMYSELLRVKICLALDDSSSQRAWASVVSCSYLRCFGVSGGLLCRWPTPWFPEVRTRMGREPNERRCFCR